MSAESRQPADRVILVLALVLVPLSTATMLFVRTVLSRALLAMGAELPNATRAVFAVPRPLVFAGALATLLVVATRVALDRDRAPHPAVPAAALGAWIALMLLACAAAALPLSLAFA